jgi:hypothetical protein
MRFARLPPRRRSDRRSNAKSAVEKRKLALVAARSFEATRGEAEQPHRTRSGLGPRQLFLGEFSLFGGGGEPTL